MGKVRIQFDVDEESFKELEKLRDLTKASTRKEFIDSAFTLFSWAIEEVNKGKRIGALSESGKVSEIYWMPLLRNAYREQAPAGRA